MVGVTTLTASTRPSSGSNEVEGGGVEPLGDEPGLVGVGVGDADELDVGQAGQDPGVVLAQVPDADHRHPQARHFVPQSQVVKSSGRQVVECGAASAAAGVT